MEKKYTDAHYRHLERVRASGSIFVDLETHNTASLYGPGAGYVTSTYIFSFWAMGPERIVKEYPYCVCLDTIGEYQLVFPLIMGDRLHFGGTREGRPFVFSGSGPRAGEVGSASFGILVMKNPSTGDLHYEYVPREMNTVEDALNWRARRVFQAAGLLEQHKWYPSVLT